MTSSFNRVRQAWRRIRATHGARQEVDVLPEQPLISFTFDDFPRSALQPGGDILREHGVRGTYYASLGLMEREIPAGRAFTADDLAQAYRDGHELGCHTFAHCHGWETPPRVFEQSILDNRRALAALLPDARFRTLSYPIALPRPGTKRRAIRHFSCCRGGGQTFNRGRVDAANLHACFLEKCGGDPLWVQRLVDTSCRENGWLILATHDVSPSPSPYGCRPDYFAAVVRHCVQSGALVLPVAEAWPLALSRRGEGLG